MISTLLSRQVDIPIKAASGDTAYTALPSHNRLLSWTIRPNGRVTAIKLC
ncbi:hypothetical protein [Magnetococcus marinus]|nr:hypothetical protein [Magnetococcus marinus]